MTWPAPRGDWTDEVIAELKDLWAAGPSCSQIATALNKKFRTTYSRNAVIGKVTRLGLEGRGRASAPPGVRPKSAPKHRGGTKSRIVRSIATAPLPELRVIEAHVDPRPWLERRFGECNWLVSGDGADSLACCGTVYRRGWCRAHFRIGTQPAKVRDKVDERLEIKPGRRFAA